MNPLGSFASPVAAQIEIIKLLSERGALSFKSLRFYMPTVTVDMLGQLVENLGACGTVRYVQGRWRLVTP